MKIKSAAFRVFVVLLLWVSGSCGMHAAGNETPLRIASASSLQFVLNDIIDQFVEQTGHAVPQVVYGSSGNLFRQIMQGAPFDLFLSADSTLVKKLEAANIAHSPGEQFGTGRLVLYAGASSRFSLKNGMDEFNAAVKTGVIGEGGDTFKIAIANPRHAPYGRAAQQSLQSMGQWDAALPGLVYAEKVSQAAQFVVSGATDLGLISLSLALSPALMNKGVYTLVPEHHHHPVVQAMMQVTDSPVGRALVEFIRDSSDADNILKRYGLR